jgi:hypothetical protein
MVSSTNAKMRAMPLVRFTIHTSLIEQDSRAEVISTSAAWAAICSFHDDTVDCRAFVCGIDGFPAIVSPIAIGFPAASREETMEDRIGWLESRVASLTDRVATLEQRLALIDGRAGTNARG